MDKLESLRKQLAEMRRLGQFQTVIGSEKYRELIAQVYEELKKIKPRPPTATEWAEVAGVDQGTIMKVRKAGGMEKFPLGYDIESFLRGRKKAVKTTLAKPTTGTLAKGSKIIGVKYRNAADKTKVRNILTKYFSVPVNERDIADTVKQLRTIKDLKPKTSGSIIQFMGFAGKNLNITPAVVTEAVALQRPSNVSDHILRSLTEHIRQKGTDFKYAPKGESTLYGQLKIIDNKTGDILTRESIREAIKNNDPRFREYATRWKELKDLKKTPFTHPVTGEKMTLLEALIKSTGNPAPLHLDHIRGVKTSPLNDLQVSTWKGNQAKAKLDLTTKEAKLFGVRTVVPGGTSIVGPDISFAKRESDLIKFATDLFLKGGTREILKPKAHLDQFITIVKKGGGCRYLTGSQGGGAVATCAEIIKRDPVGSANKLATMEATSGALGKVKNAAKGFLGALGKFGPAAGKFGALAAIGAVAQPLVKQFMNDDPSTYLTDPDQQAGMLDALIEGKRPKPRSEILDWTLGGAEVGAVASAIPGTGAVYRARRKPFTRMVEGVPKTRAAMSPLRAATIGPAMKLVSGMFTPAGLLATEPLRIAQKRREGESWGEIAKDPVAWMGPAFAPSMTKLATRGMGSGLATILRLGLPRAAMGLMGPIGWAGLAISTGLTGYDLWNDYKKKRGFFASDED